MGIISRTIASIKEAIIDTKKEREQMDADYCELKERVKCSRAKKEHEKREAKIRQRELDGAAQRAEESLNKALKK